MVPPERAPRAVQRRHLTVLFADLSGFTALSGELEPEHCLEVLDHLKRSVDRVVPKHGGIVVGVHGDGVMAMFGFPEASEQDGRRATEAALELHEAIRGFDARRLPAALRPLRMHSGVHSGLVLVIENEPEPGRYTLVGEAPNVAARLSEIAAGDELLVSAATVGGDGHFFDVRDRGALTLHGKADPVGVIQVIGPSSASTRYQARTRGGLTPFVGRVRELARLEARLHEVLAGGRRDIAIVAPPGVGKTRLIERFLLAAGPSVRVCRGYCENYLGAEPLQPFLQMLRHLAAEHGARAPAASSSPSPGTSVEAPLPELQRALALTAAQDGPPRSADEVVRALCDLFGALARQRPLVLFIDDWQWADDATLRVLAALRDGDLRPAFILMASREVSPAVSGRGDLEVLDLTPFDQDETAETVRALRPDADPFVVAKIQRLSGGNALFIEELCRWAARAPVEPGVEPGNALPAWLSTLIESRVGRLPLPQADVVRAAAVIGTVIPAWLLEQVSGRREDDPIVRELAERDLIFPGEIAGTLRFKHGITRDVVYASVGLREREALHLRIAALLERRRAQDGQETLLEALAYHFRAGARPDRAAHYAELAGDRALAGGALDRARSQYTAALVALDLLQPSDANYRRWSTVVHRLGLACVYVPTRRQLAVFARAVERARERGDRLGMARAEYWLGFVHYVFGEQQHAIRHYEAARAQCAQAIEDAQLAGGDAPAADLEALAVQLLATIGQARSAAGQHEEAIALLDQALDVKRRHRSPARPAVGSAYTLACKGAALGDLGRFAEASTCFDEALDIAGRSPVEGSVLAWRAAVHAWQGRWEEARESALRAQALARRTGSVYVLAMGQAIAAYAAWVLERPPGAIDAIVRATSWIDTQDVRLLISANYGWLADMMAAEGRDTEARAYAAKAVQRARVRDPFGAATAWRALAAIAWRGHGPTPDRYLDLAMRAARARRSPREEAITLLHQAQRAVETGRPQEASDLAARARTAFASMEMPWHDAAARQCLVRLGSAT